mgnify:CR=1 FL=1
MGVTDWKITLYPNEEEDEITRLRRDEMEVNLAQRMVMLGYQPELMEEGDRDIRFTYKKIDPQQQQGAPGMPPPPGAPPGMPPGQMPGGHMIVPPSQPGGEGAGIRTPQGPASPQGRTSPGIGSPVTSVQQRGPPNSLAQKNQAGISNARRIKGA